LKQLNTEQAEQCIQLSELLLELAQQQQWQRFEALQPQRDRLINQLVAKDYPASQSAAIRLTVARIQALDNQTRALTDAFKQQTLTEIRTDATAKKAVSAYQKAQRRY
jgi:translation initiation factor 2B subunit (eIF-2B alpha/beta/delta family)